MADLCPNIRVPQRLIPGLPASASANVFQISVKTKHFFDPEEVKKEITTLVFIIYRRVILQRFLLLSSFLFLFPMWEFPAILFILFYFQGRGGDILFFLNLAHFIT